MELLKLLLDLGEELFRSRTEVLGAVFVSDSSVIISVLHYLHANLLSITPRRPTCDCVSK